MSSTEITIALQRGSAEHTLFLKSKIAVVNMQRLGGGATIKLQKNIFGRFDGGGWFDDYFDFWFDKQGIVAAGIILKLQGDK